MEPQKEIVIVDLKGTFGFQESPVKSFAESLLQEGRRLFVVNLTEVPDLGSHGIGDLVAANLSIRKAGGKVAFIPSNSVRQKLALASLDEVLSLHSNEAEALRFVLS